MVDEVFNVCNQILHAAKTTTPDCSLRDDVEPDFHLVEPRRVRRRVVNMKPRTSGQPTPNLWMFMRGVIIHDQVKVQIGGHALVDLAQKLQKLLMAMARGAARQYVASGHVPS